MTNQVQDEAAKAAKLIRDVLEEFTRRTGLKADVSANWIDLRTVGSHSRSGFPLRSRDNGYPTPW